MTQPRASSGKLTLVFSLQFVKGLCCTPNPCLQGLTLVGTQVENIRQVSRTSHQTHPCRGSVWSADPEELYLRPPSDTLWF